MRISLFQNRGSEQAVSISEVRKCSRLLSLVNSFIDQLCHCGGYLLVIIIIESKPLSVYLMPHPSQTSQNSLGGKGGRGKYCHLGRNFPLRTPLGYTLPLMVSHSPNIHNCFGSENVVVIFYHSVFKLSDMFSRKCQTSRRFAKSGRGKLNKKFIKILKQVCQKSTETGKSQLCPLNIG